MFSISFIYYLATKHKYTLRGVKHEMKHNQFTLRTQAYIFIYYCDTDNLNVQLINSYTCYTQKCQQHNMSRSTVIATTMCISFQSNNNLLHPKCSLGHWLHTHR